MLKPELAGALWLLPPVQEVCMLQPGLVPQNVELFRLSKDTSTHTLDFMLNVSDIDENTKVHIQCSPGSGISTLNVFSGIIFQMTIG